MNLVLEIPLCSLYVLPIDRSTLKVGNFFNFFWGKSYPEYYFKSTMNVKRGSEAGIN